MIVTLIRRFVHMEFTVTDDTTGRECTVQYRPRQFTDSCICRTCRSCDCEHVEAVRAHVLLEFV